MKREKEILDDALVYVGIPSLPDEWKKDDAVWVRAIAKIMTRTGAVSYALVENNYDAQPRLKKLFSDGGFGAVISIHPYESINSDLMPVFDDANQIRDYILAEYEISKEEVKKLSNKKMMALVFNAVITKQICDGKKREAEKNRQKNDETEENEE